MIKAILLDIEGTTTPIDFVHKKLFPFAKARLNDFIGARLASLGNTLVDLRAEYKRDFQDQIYGRNFNESDPATIVNYLEFLIDVDRKSTPLKSIQGEIWKAGYESGELVSELFPDVFRAIENWRSKGLSVAIFSSGSVLAQQLIFKYSNAGDLGPFISAYFDTTTGKKQESASYSTIARELGVKPGEMLFVSDVVTELDAAHDAGARTALSMRPGNGLVKAPIAHDAVGSLTDLEI